jgi:hypothetical protein
MRKGVREGKFSFLALPSLTPMMEGRIYTFIYIYILPSVMEGSSFPHGKGASAG